MRKIIPVLVWKENSRPSEVLVQELSLSNIPMGKLPGDVAKLRHLRRLHLSNCLHFWAADVLPDGMRSLTHLTELDLSRNGLTLLPEV